VKHSQLMRLTVALCLLFVSACTTPFPGYRHEGEGPDERLLDLMDMREQEAREFKTDDEKKELGAQLVDPARTMNELRKLHLEYPTHVPTLFAIALLEHESGARERSSGFLDAIFSVEAVHPEAGILRSRMAIEDGNLPAARRVLEQQINYTPDHFGLREAMSATAFLDGDLERARSEIEMARRLGAPQWRVAFNLGLIEEADGNRIQAMKDYEVALLERPEFPEAASRLAGLRALFGDVVR
jgi:tetratricopeptide (TPR) repeat protein